MQKKIFNPIWLFAVVTLVISVCLIFNYETVYAFFNKIERPIIFSENRVLNSLWRNYKLEYLEPGTFRTLDKQQNNITTSEGQSYSMLRSVWTDDKPTFDSVWQWTQDNLRQPNSKLFSWLFGQRSNGTYGVMAERGGNNSASDADVDIALALHLASIRWNEPKYKAQAIEIIKDIWENEVVIVNGNPVLVANNLERNNDLMLVNPSYFAPYAFRKFAQLDPSNPWEELAKNSYNILNQATAQNLDKNKSAYLPPDWIVIDRVSGQIKPAQSNNFTSNYGYEAIRIPWRIALDWQWYQNEDAKQYLQKLSFLKNEWETNKKIMAVYAHDGEVVQNFEQLSAYGGSLGYFTVVNPELANQVVEQKIISRYSPDQNSWKIIEGYYDDNWAWFGYALHLNFTSDFE